MLIKRFFRGLIANELRLEALRKQLQIDLAENFKRTEESRTTPSEEVFRIIDKNGRGGAKINDYYRFFEEMADPRRVRFGGEEIEMLFRRHDKEKRACVAQKEFLSEV